MKFSIIIPAYKQTYLKECIDSCLAQTYQDFEVIIVNDASPEDIDSIVSVYDDPRIRYYKNEKNCGAVDVVDNWNKCLEYAIGDYVICMGDDDMLPKDSLVYYTRAIDKYSEIDVFHARTIIVDEKGNHLSITSDRAEWESVYSFVRHRIEGSMQFIGDFCIRRSKLQELGGYIKLPLAWGSDDITVYEAAQERGVVNLQKPSFIYRSNPTTISRSANIIYKLKAIEQEEDWYCSFVRKGHALLDEIDRLDCLYVKNHYHNKIEMKRGKCIAEDIRGNFFRWFKWFYKRKEYRLSNAVLIVALYEFAKGLYFSKYNKNISYS